jgi:hypothetical protein
MGDEASDEQKVKWAAPDNLVGDVDVAAFGISGLRWERAFSMKLLFGRGRPGTKLP